MNRRTFLTAMLASPVVAALPAVAYERVHSVPEVWEVWGGRMWRDGKWYKRKFGVWYEVLPCGGTQSGQRLASHQSRQKP